jgi:hypothetical protein
MFLAAMLLLAGPLQTSVVARPVETIPELPRPSMTIVEDSDRGPAPTVNCPVPRPRQNQKFVFLGFYQGTAVADQSVAGLESETTTGAIHIAPGARNLFLAITSQRAMIFRFSGHVERLNQLVVLNWNAAGVTGVSPAKVSFGVGAACEMDSGAEHAVKFGYVNTVFGRRPDALGGTQDLHEWIIGATGAGTEIKAPDWDYDTQDTRLEEQFASFYPGGVVKIDPATLISSQTAEKYEILPNAAGVVQLERAGKIVRATKQEVDAWRVLAKQRYGKIMDQIGVDDAYRVVEPIDLPAAMCGGHLLYLLLPSEEYARGRPCHNYLLLSDGRMMIADWSKKQNYVERLAPLKVTRSSR